MMICCGKKLIELVIGGRLQFDIRLLGWWKIGDWGTTRSSLQNKFWALMRSTFDYGCIA